MYLQSLVVLVYISIYCIGNNEKWLTPLPCLVLTIVEVASKIISERENVGWIFLIHIITHVKL